MKTILITLLAGAAFLSTARAYPTLPYTDSFNGSGPGNPAPDIHVDDNGVSFWTTIPSSFTTPEQATEAGGQANLTSATEFGATVVNNTLSSAFNFFAAPLTFSLSGLSMAGTASAANQQFVFAVQDGASQTYYASDSVASVSITGNNQLAFDIKQIGSFGAMNLLSTTLSGTPTGFDLTLNGLALTYKLVVTESTGSQTFSGSLPSTLSQSLWGPNNNQGASAISFAVFDNQAPAVQGVPDSDATATVGQISVTPVPEASVWALSVAGGALLVVSQRVRRRSLR